MEENGNLINKINKIDTSCDNIDVLNNLVNDFIFIFDQENSNNVELSNPIAEKLISKFRQIFKDDNDIVKMLENNQMNNEVFQDILNRKFGNNEVSKKQFQDNVSETHNKLPIQLYSDLLNVLSKIGNLEMTKETREQYDTLYNGVYALRKLTERTIKNNIEVTKALYHLYKGNPPVTKEDDGYGNYGVYILILFSLVGAVIGYMNAPSKIGGIIVGGVVGVVACGIILSLFTNQES